MSIRLGKSIGACAAIILLFVVTGSAVNADEVLTHTFGGSDEKAVTVDDDGGYSEGFLLTTNSEKHVFEGTFVLWDGNGTFDGFYSNAFEGTGSGIVLFEPAAGLGEVTEATGRSVEPFRPVTFSGGPFSIEQSTFVKNTEQFVIYQWRVRNTGTAPIPAKLLLAADWDIAESSEDERTGFDATRRLAFQQDSPGAGGDDFFTAGGFALLSGTLDNFRLGVCCEFISEPAIHLDYMNGVGTGDLDDGTVSDKEIGLSADLGMLAPGASACVAFAQAAARGTSLEDGLANLQAQVDAAAAVYGTIPPEFTCAAEPAPCVGDCGEDDEVTVEEIITMTNIALGNAELDDCRAGDKSGDGQITVDEILTAVTNALEGCNRP